MKFGPINTYLLYTMCNDGTKSNSTGSGTCSWHGGEAVSGGIGSSGITGIIVAMIMVVATMSIFGVVVLINNQKKKKWKEDSQEQERKYLAQIDKQINWKNKKWTIVGFKYVDGTPRFQSKWNNGKMIRNINVSEVMDQLENQQITQQIEQPESKPIKEKPESKPIKEEPKKIIPKGETGPYESVIPRMIRLRYIISTNDESGEIILFRKWDEVTFKYNAFDFKKLNCYEDPYAKMIANRMKK